MSANGGASFYEGLQFWYSMLKDLSAGPQSCRARPAEAARGVLSKSLPDTRFVVEDPARFCP